MFHPAHRKESKLRLALIGPSGSGKTYSALLIAQGLGRKVALLDTERGSASLYAHLCQFDVSELAPPFTPEKYVQAIRHASLAGYDVLILDSLTHAWTGEGGILDFVDNANKNMRNIFEAWHKANPKHTTLVDSMLSAPMHIIATIRSKTVWDDMVKEEHTGKTKPVKFGLAPFQRDGLEYEFTTVLELSMDGHVATAIKDRTGLFDGRYFTPGKETGEKLISWLTGGQGVPGNSCNGENLPNLLPLRMAPVVDLPIPKPQPVQTRRGTRVDDLFAVLADLGLANLSKTYEQCLVRKYGHDSRELTAEQITEQYVNLSRCRRDKVMFKQLLDYLVLMEHYKEAA
jgi:hypothetical protein